MNATKRFQDEKLVHNKAHCGESLGASYDNYLLQGTWLYHGFDHGGQIMFSVYIAMCGTSLFLWLGKHTIKGSCVSSSSCFITGFYVGRPLRHLWMHQWWLSWKIAKCLGMEIHAYIFIYLEFYPYCQKDMERLPYLEQWSKYIKTNISLLDKHFLISLLSVKRRRLKMVWSFLSHYVLWLF